MHLEPCTRAESVEYDVALGVGQAHPQGRVESLLNTLVHAGADRRMQQSNDGMGGQS